MFINQLFNEENDTFLTFAGFRERYPNLQTNFLVYNGIVRAIEQYRDRHNIELTSRYHEMNASKVWMVVSGGSKMIKSVFLTSDILPSAVVKWNNIFDGLRWKKYSHFVISSKM